MISDWQTLFTLEVLNVLLGSAINANGLGKAPKESPALHLRNAIASSRFLWLHQYGGQYMLLDILVVSQVLVTQNEKIWKKLYARSRS